MNNSEITSSSVEKLTDTENNPVRVFSMDEFGTTGQELAFKTWTFPGGEVGVKFDGDFIRSGRTFVISVYGKYNPAVWDQISQIVSIIRSTDPYVHVCMVVPYLPYARQDRACNKGEDFALDTFVRTRIAPLDLNVLVVWDVHSDVAKECIRKHAKIEVVHFLDQDIFYQEMFNMYDFVVYPDAGAAKKMEVNFQLPFGTKPVVMEKTRTANGVAYKKYNGEHLFGKILVVDDICDGGATFISLAEKILESSDDITQLDLSVTHGIFSKGLVPLYGAGYDNVFAVNNMSDNPNVISPAQHVINVKNVQSALDN